MWERIRLPIIRRLVEEQRRKYDWARRGASAEQAVWLQLLEAEALGYPDGPGGEGPLTVLLDLVKCFGHVRLAHVSAWGQRWRVPLG